MRPFAWPDDLSGPGTQNWRAKSANWLLDRCPAEYRTYELFRLHYEVLAWVALAHIEASLEAARECYRNARTGLETTPGATAELLHVLEVEGARLAIEAKAAAAVASALMDLSLPD